MNEENNSTDEHLKLGRIARKNKNDYVKAEEHYLKALDFSKETKSNSKIAEALNELGLTYMGMGDKEKRLKCYEDALRIRKALWGDHAHVDVAESLSNVGLAMETIEGLDFLEQAIKMYGDLKMSADASIACCFDASGGILMKLFEKDGFEKYLDFALQSFEKALEIRRSNDLHEDMAYSFHNMGGCYFELFKMSKDEKHLQKSFTLLNEAVEAFGDNPHSARSLEILEKMHSESI